MDYVKEFENDCRIRGLTKQTILTYKCNVLDFLAATHECPAAVTQGDLRDHLYRAGMDPQYIKWLRGDSLQKEAWQVHNHIDIESVRMEYERCIPKLL